MDTAPDAKTLAKLELAGFGIEVNEANIDMVERCQKAKQVNAAEEPLYRLSAKVLAGEAGAEDRLRKEMAERGIKEIVHAEGPTVWDHVKLGLTQIESLPISDAKKKYYRAIFLYHDIGKTDKAIIAANAEKNQTPLKAATGQYNIAFVGHADFEKMSPDAETVVRQGLGANGLSPAEVNNAILILKNHMAGGVIESGSRLANSAKIYKQMDEETFKDLLNVLLIDGTSTVSFNVDSGSSMAGKKASIPAERLLENIKTYNRVFDAIAQTADAKTRDKQGQLANKFFKAINNFDAIDAASLSQLEQKLNALANPETQAVAMPDELRPLAELLADKSQGVAEVYARLKQLAGNEKALSGIVNGVLRGKLGLSEEQIMAVIGTLK